MSLVSSITAAQFEPIGCWAEVGDARFGGRPALFLDRDGVVVEEVNYLGRVEDVALSVAAGATIAAFNQVGVPVVLVTNQAGVARGYFSWADFEAVQTEMARQLALAGAHIDAAFACGCHADGQGALAVADHPWRKPRPGMLLAAAERLGVDLGRSAIVGDRAQDLAAGQAAGLALGMHVATGHGSASERELAAALRGPAFEVMLAPNIGGAVALLERLAQG